MGKGSGFVGTDSDARGGPTDRGTNQTGNNFNTFPVSDEVRESRGKKKRQLQHVGE